MDVRKMYLNSDATIPLIAAFPYGVTLSEGPCIAPTYDPRSQLTTFARRDFSTCREDESAGGLFRSKSDTQKDD